MDFVPLPSFARIASRYGGSSGVHTLSCFAQCRAVALAQLAWRESLRDIEAKHVGQSARVKAVVASVTLLPAEYVEQPSPC